MMTALRLGFAFISVVAPALAWPQCATGVNTGGGNCVPPDAAGMPDYRPDDAASAYPEPVWKDTWGAIVLDVAGVSKGVATNMDTKSQAVATAMNECQANGASHCKVELTYYSQCAAVAWGDGVYGVAKNKTLDEAVGDAVHACSSRGSGCVVAYKACSPPRRIQ